MASPGITVLMSAFNGERFLEAAVASILGQSFVDFEFLIIDDCSRDRTAALLESFRDPRIRILRNAENLGLTRSLNLGLEAARGRYVARMDCDDISLPGRLRAQWDFMESDPGMAACGCWARIIDEEGRITGRIRTPSSRAVEGLFWRPPVIIHPSAFIRRSLLGDLRYDSGLAYAQDYDLWLRLRAAGRLGNLPEYHLHYRLHGGGITSAKRAEQLRISYAIFSAHAAGAGVSREEYDSLLFANLEIPPLARARALARLGSLFPIPLGFQAKDNLKYAVKRIAGRLRGR